MSVIRKDVIQAYLDGYNDFDINKMLENLHQDVVFENITNGQVNLRTEGKTAFKKQAEQAKKYFSKRQQTAESWELISDEKVKITIKYRGVLAIDFPTGQKTGDILELRGESEFLFKENKIIKITDKS